MSRKPFLLVHRYTLREFLHPFGIGLLTFTFVLTLHYLFLMMDLFLNRGVQLFLVLKMALLVLPMLFPISLPMAALLASLMAYGRMTEEGELTALKSSGCSLSQYTTPNILFGLVLSFILIYFNLFLAPKATGSFKDLHHSFIQKNPLALFAPKVMNHFGEYKIIVETMDRKKKKLSGIGIYKLNNKGAPTRILAPEGTLEVSAKEGITLQLLSGAIHQPNPDKEQEYTITKFNKLALRIPAEIHETDRVLTPREMTYPELRKKIKESVTKKTSTLPWQTENNLRVALSFAPFVFVLLGTGIGVRIKKSSRSTGIGLTLVILLVYYGLVILAISLSTQGVFSPLVLTWIPNLIMIGAGVLLLRKAAEF